MNQFLFTIQKYSGRDGKELRCVCVSQRGDCPCQQHDLRTENLGVADDRKHSCTSYTACTTVCKVQSTIVHSQKREVVVNQKSGLATLGSSSVMPHK